MVVEEAHVEPMFKYRRSLYAVAGNFVPHRNFWIWQQRDTVGPTWSRIKNLFLGSLLEQQDGIEEVVDAKIKRDAVSVNIGSPTRRTESYNDDPKSTAALEKAEIGR